MAAKGGLLARPGFLHTKAFCFRQRFSNRPKKHGALGATAARMPSYSKGERIRSKRRTSFVLMRESIEATPMRSHSWLIYAGRHHRLRRPSGCALGSHIPRHLTLRKYSLSGKRRYTNEKKKDRLETKKVDRTPAGSLQSRMLHFFSSVHA